jgi:hypothetical protein
VIEIIGAILAAFAAFFRGRLELSLEVLALRQQVAVLKRKRRRPMLSRLDRLFWIMRNHHMNTSSEIGFGKGVGLLGFRPAPRPSCEAATDRVAE